MDIAKKRHIVELVIIAKANGKDGHLNPNLVAITAEDSLVQGKVGKLPRFNALKQELLFCPILFVGESFNSKIHDLALTSTKDLFKHRIHLVNHMVGLVVFLDDAGDSNSHGNLA